MARVIVTDGKGKRFTKEGTTVSATLGVVAGNEYYELCVVASDEGVERGGKITVTKNSSKDPIPKEVYRVPQKKLRKKAPTQPQGTPNPPTPIERKA